MAQKTLRLHNYAQHNSGWSESIFPPADSLGKLPSDCNKIATSIPSPFAQFDLVKDAFGKITEKGNFSGTTPQHRIISYALDVAQLFYQSNKYTNDIQIVAWDTRSMANLIDNYVLSDSLNTFWKQDARVYDFDKVDQLFFLIYRNKIIGSTSPATLFVSAPDAASIGMTLNSGNHYFFKDIKGLQERDEEFILYFYQLVYQDRRTLGLNELRKYLQALLDKNILSYELSSKIVNEEFPLYAPCQISAGNNCFIASHQLGIALPQSARIKAESDFLLKPDYQLDEIPLVLPNTTFNNRWNYTFTSVIWERDKVAPEKGTDRLPFNGEQYPWLGIADFLEDTLIEIPYDIDPDYTPIKNSPNVLLPLKETFFKYFKAENIANYLTIKRNPIDNNSIVIDLKVPTRKGYIEYQKIYSKLEKTIIEWSGDLCILPFYKSSDDQVPLSYTIGVIDGETNHGNNIPKISLIYKDKIISNIDSRTRLDGKISENYAAFYKYQQNFDALRISVSGKQGIIIPQLKYYNARGIGMDVSVDFGTTNTHIECKTSNAPEEFCYSYEQNPLYKTFLIAKEEYTLNQQECFEHLIFPKTIAKRNENGVSYPLRSALLTSRSQGSMSSFDIYLEANSHLLHNKIFESRIFDSISNLKWENFSDPINRARLDAYIESILRLIYYKAVSMDRNLRDINITWFYPVSMSRNNLNIMDSVWKKKYKEVFNNTDAENHVFKLTESIAPYYCYRKTGRNVMGLSTSIDIGGGSADIAIFGNKKSDPVVISSFKFAGNAIFGDGFGGGPSSNGFVQYFKESALNNADSNERNMLENLISNYGSEEFSNFAFSMKNYNYLEEIKFSTDIKLCVLIYYSSLIYYVAQFMLRNEYQIPTNLMFSGNGSKTLKILDSSNNCISLSKLFTRIFEHVYEDKADRSIRIITDEDPKVLTCKGGLYVDQNNINSEDDGIIPTSLRHWVGGIGVKETESIMKEGDFDNILSYDQLESKHINSVAESINDLYRICDKCLSKEINLTEHFGIDKSAYELFKSIRNQNIKQYLEEIKNEEGSDKISQTLFFVPLIGVISDLACEISNN